MHSEPVAQLDRDSIRAGITILLFDFKPMDENQPPDQVIDFSHYTDNLTGASQPVLQPQDNQLSTRRPYARIALVTGLVVFLAAVWFALTHRRQAAQYIAPPGYQVVQPPNQPPRLKKFPHKNEKPE